jgi:hypothetical protein
MRMGGSFRQVAERVDNGNHFIAGYKVKKALWKAGRDKKISKNGPREDQDMTAIKGILKNGHIELKVPPEWPEGCEVVVEPLAMLNVPIGLDESAWSNDPASLADWEAWLPTIEPLELTPEEEASFRRFDEQMRHFNVEAVRRQMEQGPLP